MIVNSNTLLHSFISKYVNAPTKTTPKVIFDDIKFTFTIHEKYSLTSDINYNIILSNIEDNERIMFIRFFQIYLFKIYKKQIQFINNGEINWDDVSSFINENKLYYNLFLTSFHYFF
jgi:hypothetical protein